MLYLVRDRRSGTRHLKLFSLFWLADAQRSTKLQQETELCQDEGVKAACFTAEGFAGGAVTLDRTSSVGKYRWLLLGALLQISPHQADQVLA
jgi:hypothetical protein